MKIIYKSFVETNVVKSSLIGAFLIFLTETFMILKGIKYEIRLGKPNRPIDEPNGPMSTSPKKGEPILRVGP